MMLGTLMFFLQLMFALNLFAMLYLKMHFILCYLFVLLVKWSETKIALMKVCCSFDISNHIVHCDSKLTLQNII